MFFILNSDRMSERPRSVGFSRKLNLTGNDAPLFETQSTNEKMITKNTPVQKFLNAILPRRRSGALRGLQWLIEKYDIGKICFCDKAVNELCLRTKRHNFFAILMWVSLSLFSMMITLGGGGLLPGWAVAFCPIIFVLSLIAWDRFNPKKLTVEDIDPVFASIIEKLNGAPETSRIKIERWQDPTKAKNAAEEVILYSFQILVMLEEELKKMNPEDPKLLDTERKANDQRRRVHDNINLLKSNNVVDRDFRSWHQEILEIMKRRQQ